LTVRRAPLSYVLAAHGDTIRVKHRVHPLGVAMAGVTCMTRTRTEGPRERPLSLCPPRVAEAKALATAVVSERKNTAIVWRAPCTGFCNERLRLRFGPAEIQ
jgi:hypothetical protein